MKTFVCSASALALGWALAGPVTAQTAVAGKTGSGADAAAPTTTIGEIIVTAQKRSQSINDVGISITAQTGQELAAKGVVNTADLSKVVPGFVFTPAPFGAPVYTLRGVGLYDSGLASSPALSVYVDEVALPYPMMTKGAVLDLERVEVLKGPQGTLFGQNNTGGAINYIAAKPTRDIEGAANVSVARFGKVDATAHLSGPLTDTLGFRVAARTVQGGAWQVSRTRPNDHNGDSNQFYGRILLEWKPVDRLSVLFNVNGWTDRSQTQAPQLQAIDKARILADPHRAKYPIFLDQPVAYQNARSADWTPGFPKSNDRFIQASLRADYELANDITLTSITAYSDLNVYEQQDVDATAVTNTDLTVSGKIRDISQELRASGHTGPFHWLLGANYGRSTTTDNELYDLTYVSVNKPDLAFGPNGIGIPPFEFALATVNQTITSKALFGSAEYKFDNGFSVEGSGRYTWTDRRAFNCGLDPSADQPLNAFYNTLQAAVKGPANVVPLGPGSCNALDNTFTPMGVHQRLKEGNFSFRGAVNYKTDGGSLVYASFSRGYKAGIISNVAASATRQYLPVPQERLDAVEAGVKMPLANRRAHFNAAAFYYDYADKQLRARVLDNVFGTLETLVTVPQSRIYGLEGELQTELVDGLTASISGTYLNSKISGDFITSNGSPVFNQGGQAGNFKGSPLPYTPRFTGTADVEYRRALSETLDAKVGGTVFYHSRDNASLNSAGVRDPNFDLPQYTTIDLRAGLEGNNGRWSAQLFVRNLTNKYYWTTVFQTTDERHRYAALPRTYGIDVGVKF